MKASLDEKKMFPINFDVINYLLFKKYLYFNKESIFIYFILFICFFFKFKTDSKILCILYLENFRIVLMSLLSGYILAIDATTR